MASQTETNYALRIAELEATVEEKNEALRIIDGHIQRMRPLTENERLRLTEIRRVISEVLPPGLPRPKPGEEADYLRRWVVAPEPEQLHAHVLPTEQEEWNRVAPQIARALSRRAATTGGNL